MKIRLNKLATAAPLFALAPMAANAAPTLNPANGHYYEVVPSGAITWDAAKLAADAASFTFNGVQVPGHLATITSLEEDAFVDQLRENAGVGQAWVGGSQADTQSTTGDGWQWENGEGVIPGADSHFPDPYANWGDNNSASDVEPNDGDGTENNAENHLAIGRYGFGGGWNDEGVALNLIEAFMVEFSGTVDASLCIDIDGGQVTCNPSGVQTVVLPANITLPSGATITQGLVRFAMSSTCPPATEPSFFVYRDTRVDEDGRPNGPMVELILSNFFAVIPPAGEELILDQYTYGSPCVAVVKGGANFDLTPALVNGGVITSRQIPELVPNIGQVLGCDDSDLQRRTQFGYGTDIRFDMEEETSASMTAGCNSPSRASTLGFSNFTLNTHEDGGISFSGPGDLAVIQFFSDRAIAKYDLLEQVILRSQVNVDSSTFKKIHSKFNQARSMTKTFNYGKADLRLKDLLVLVEGANWDVNNGFNDPGNMIMRIKNLIYRNAQLDEVN
ncbi:MAG: hypothetical protein E4H01_08705 [Lysobacterales bacterium]|nr:MAG: hypothetical protein E4H01_08705 [Xanthomonadales bacterium]